MRVRIRRAPSRCGLRVAAALILALGAAAPARGAGAPRGGPEAEATVRLGEDGVLPLFAGRGSSTAGERARAASRALAEAAQESPDAVARVEIHGETASIVVGRASVLELGPEDVAAAGAAGLEPLAQVAAARIDRALARERRRATIANWVFDVSILVFSALVAFLLARKVGDLGRRAARWARRHPDRVPSLRAGTLEVVSGRGMAGALEVALRLGRGVLQAAIAYAWLVLALSIFPATRGAASRLGHLVLSPAADLVGRLGSALPVLLAAAVAGLGLFVVLRAVHLFAGSVARGETHLSWLPSDLARPAGQLVALALVLLAAVFAAPALTGSDQGVLSHLGTAALVATGLAIVPPLANLAVGLPRVFRRTLRPGDAAELGGASGVVRDVSLQHVELEDSLGRRVIVSHLSALIAPTRVGRGRAAAVAIVVVVAADEDQDRVRELLLAAGGRGTAAELIRISAEGTVWRVAGPGEDLAVRVAGALTGSGIRLGHAPAGAGAPGSPGRAEVP